MTLIEKQARLARRLKREYDRSMTKPGSMNDHKCMPAGRGKRGKSKVRSDSRTATA